MNTCKPRSAALTACSAWNLPPVEMIMASMPGVLIHAAAINTLTKYVATQFAAQHVRCNAVIPGLIMTTALERGMPAPMQEIFRQHTLTGHLGEPRDIAEMVLFLASDRSKFITGQEMPVDGGLYAHIPTTVQVAELFAKPQQGA